MSPYWYSSIVSMHAQVEPTFPLINTPDVDLDEEGVKEKRRQKLMKAGYDARIRLKAEKEAERAKQVRSCRCLDMIAIFIRIAKEYQAKADLERRLADPQAWANDVRVERQVRHGHRSLTGTANLELAQACLTRIAERAKKRSALSDRKSVAAQSRMKSIATLAADMPAQKRKRKKGGGALLR